MNNETSCFLALLMLTGYSDERLRLEIRPLHPAWRQADLYPEGNAPAHWAALTPRGARQWFPVTEGALKAGARHCGRLSGRFEVYCGVLPRLGSRGKQEDVVTAGWLWCDVDGGIDGVVGARRLLAAADIPAPSLVVCSGNGLHTYWQLADAIPLPDLDSRFRFKQLLQRLCKAIGGAAPGAHADSSRADVASILRVPGTFNNKRRDLPKPVTVETFQPEAETHSLTWWRANLPALPCPPTKSDTVGDPMTVAAGLLRWAREPIPEGDRHKTLCAAAAWLIRDKGIGRPQVLDLLVMKSEASPGQRIITREELEGIIRWAR